MNIFKKIIGGSSAFSDYQKLNERIDDLGKFVTPFNEERLARQVALDRAKAAFYAKPGKETMGAWEKAHLASVGVKANFSQGSSLTALQSIAADAEGFVDTQRTLLKTSTEAKRIYRRCLVEIIEGIRRSITAKRSEISSKLIEIEATFNADEIQPLPLWNARVGALEKLLGDLDVQSAHPAVLMRQGLIDEVREAIERGQRHLTDAAPAPPAPRQMQGFVAGGNLPTNHGVMNPTNPTPDTALPTVPPEVAQAIRQQLVEQQNKHFREQERQMTERLAAERTAAATKEAQAVA